MGLSDASEQFICKTKTLHIAHSRGPSCSPPWWWTQCTCTCSALTQLPLGGPDLHAHSFPNWALNPGKERRGGKKKKGREKETKSYFYGKLRSDCGAIFQVHLNKSIKAYPNTKGGRLRLPLPPFLFAVYIWQSKLRPGACASVYLKQTEHR